MWRVKSLTLRDFMAHKDSKIVFESGKAVMIYGENHFNKGQNSNGSGKSAILEGLCIATIGSSLKSDVSDKLLVRRGCDSAEIVEELYNTKTKKSVVITRTIFSNSKSSEVDIKVDGKPLDEISRNGQDKYDVREANNWILGQLQISKEDLLNYFFVSKRKYKPFFAQSDTDKKNVIGRFSQSNQVDSVFVEINSEIASLQEELDETLTKIQSNDAKVEAYQEQIDEFDIDELKSKRDKEIAEAKLKIEQLQPQIKKYMDLGKAQREQYNALKLQKDNVPEIKDDVSDVEKTLQQFKKELQEFEAERREINSKLSKYERNLLGSIECPKCSHEFNPAKKDVDIEKERENVIKAKELLEDVDHDIKDVSDDISETKAKIELRDKKLSERRKKVREIEDQIDRKRKDMRTTANEIDNIQTTIDINENRILNLESKKIDDPTAELQAKIDKLNKETSDLSQGIEHLENDMFDTRQWENHFIKFKTHLSNKTIGVIQAHCNEYLSKMGTDLSLIIEGYKINRDKSITEKITTHVSVGGQYEDPIGVFSGGEEAKLIVSMILAQQKLINMSCPSGGLDMCFLDEVIESVDSDGITGLMESLQLLKQTIVVITHGTFDKKYPYVKTVVKQQNGIATIK